MEIQQTRFEDVNGTGDFGVSSDFQEAALVTFAVSRPMLWMIPIQWGPPDGSMFKLDSSIWLEYGTSM